MTDNRSYVASDPSTAFDPSVLHEDDFGDGDVGVAKVGLDALLFWVRDLESRLTFVRQRTDAAMDCGLILNDIAAVCDDPEMYLDEPEITALKGNRPPSG